MMDSNINLLNFEPSSPSVKLIETALENGFIQTINKATRIFNKKVHCPKELGSFRDIDGNVTAKKLYT